MRLAVLLLLTALAVHEAQSAAETCYDKIEECHMTNYKEYVNCVRRRQKRSLDCNSGCDSDNCIGACTDCDCSSCGYSTCQNSCDSCCSTCCNNYNSCTNNHCCHKTCHAQCRTSSCRSSCRKSCYDRVTKLDEETVSNSSNTNVNDNRHNITTIIHLNNVINNTNIIDIPISLNNTNHQNITLYEANRGGGTAGGESCCIVISPRQCVPSKEPPFIRCFHYRSRQCGEYCTAPIVHREQQQICQSSFPGSAPSCRQSVIYIPQPQPRCTYQSTWPYVSCGISRTESCAGCYSHYVNTNAQDYLTCPSGCYDEGFGVGPYFRQGPVYRPNFSHAPCYTCYGVGGYGAPYGGFPSYGGGYQGYGGYGGYPSFGGYPQYAPGADTGFGDQSLQYGSWAPNVVDTYQHAENNSDPSVEALFKQGPNVMNTPFDDIYRVSRELEIDVNFEPKSDVQAEVKIKDSDKDLEESEDSEGNNSTQTPLESKSA